MPTIPGNPYRGPSAPDRAFVHLSIHCRIAIGISSDRLHRIKFRAALGATDAVVIGRTGDVYSEATGEHLGTLTDPAA